MEALGHWGLGSAFPRKYDPEALKKAVQSANAFNPEALIPQQMKDYQKATGQTIPGPIVEGYKRDIKELQSQKNFKSDYADKHNASSYRKLPDVNKAQAGLDYLDKHKFFPPEQIKEWQQNLDAAQSDDEAKQWASLFWGATNAGQYKSQWTQFMAQANQTKLTKKK
jgi:hypothetical protein